MSGKGDRPRHNLERYGDGWERIFGGDGKSTATVQDGCSTQPTSKVEQTSNKQTRPSWGKRRQQAAQDRSC